MGLTVFALAVALLGAPAPVSSGEGLVAVHRDDTVARVEIENGDANLGPDVDHLWWWTKRSAPRRLEPSEVAEALAQTPRTEGKLRVEIVGLEDPASRGSEGKTESPRQSGHVIAAPLEMWREVPENLLPIWKASDSIPSTAETPWRIRFTGSAVGSWWSETRPAQATATLVARSAVDRVFTVRDAERAPVAGARFRLIEPGAGGGVGKALTFYTSDEQGRVVLPAVPDAIVVHLLVEAEGWAIEERRGSLGEFPAEIVLAKGARLQGRLVDAEDRPLPDVELSFKSWAASGLALLLERRATTDASGSWHIDGLRSGPGFLAAEAGKAGRLERTVEVEARGTDLGRLVLWPTRVVTVDVVDENDLGVAGAELYRDGKLLASTDRDGRATLVERPDAQPGAFEIEAAGYVRAKGQIPAGVSDLRVELRPALTVVGRLARPDGAAVSEGSCVVEIGTRRELHALEADGSFRLDLPPETPADLRLSSPTTRELRVHVEGGLGGEVRDLGLLRAPRGLTVAGTVIRAADGSAVAGARVWTLRARNDGPLIAWMHQDLVSVETDAEGRFEAHGLAPGSLLLRFDAPGLARAFRQIAPEAEEDWIELDPVEMAEGATLSVHVEGAAEGAEASGASELASDSPLIASVDLRGAGLPSDVLEARVADELAVFRNVPAGAVRVAVRQDRALLCEEEVQIEPRARVAEVECEIGGHVVRGVVLEGDEPASGQLAWSTEDSPWPASILNVRGPGGLRQQKSYGGAGSRVVTAIEADGSFRSTRLRPGAWRVTWHAADGTAAEARQIEIPDLEEYELTLRYPRLRIEGLVVDGEGSPLARSRVEDLVGRHATFSDAQGAFVLRVAEPGLRQLRAKHRQLSSEVVEVEVAGDHDPDPLILVVEERPDELLELTVLDAYGQPARGALVFVETEGGRSRVLTADHEGRGTSRFEPPYPSRVRAAAFADGAWALGSWISWDDRADGIFLEIADSGSLVLSAEEASSGFELVSAGGWNLSWLLRRVGRAPRLGPGEPVRLSGLPEGSYTLSAGTFSTTVSIRAEEDTAIEIGSR